MPLWYFNRNTGKIYFLPIFKIKSEILYNNLNIFQRLSNFYGLIGFVLLILQFIGVFFPNLNLKGLFKIAFLLIFTCFITASFWSGFTMVCIRSCSLE